MRLFVAVDISPAVRASIDLERTRLAAALSHGSRVRWVRPEQMHLTLVFLGEVGESDVPAVVEAVAPPVDQPAFTLGFEGFGAFPQVGPPRALWVGVESGRSELHRLYLELRSRLRRFAPGGPDTFSPHLTLGRWRDARRSDRAHVLSAARTGEIGRTVVDHATLYESRLSSAAPVYVERARANLRSS